MTDGPIMEQVPDEYLDMVVTCPVPQGQAEGAQPLRDVLASDIGPKILPRVVENIRNAQELAGSGIEADRATIIAFGGAVVEDEHGGILREPDDALEPAYADADLEPQLEAAEKK
ncbi:MAG TPA: hypothetical protein VFX84_02105 [Candidatus Saccharimonadales bacterium]|nr:hypothetical protein [Candidatus Saccharimonadales bacterium]